MKQYFTKWLPVEGEMHCTNTECGSKFKFTDKKAKECINCGSNLEDNTKLFLCSRDIQVGDEFWYSSQLTNFNLEKGIAVKPLLGEHKDFEGNNLIKDSKGFFHHRVDSFKVIGEISPDAYSFVKEGDEFDREELVIFYINEYGKVYFETEFYESNWFNLRDDLKKNVIIGVKGPCGHAH